MKLLELYLDEIRQNLPPRNREDIIKEIRSTLMDMIEDRNPNPGTTPDDATVKAVLVEFGAPRKVARQYSSRNYLIGPRMYPVYIQVLRIVLIVVAALNLLGVIISIISQTGFDGNAFEATLQVVGGLFSSLFTAFGIVTLSFAGIERTTPDEWRVKVNEKWDPDDLLKHEYNVRVKVVEIALEITFSLIFIVLINFFLDKIGIYYLGPSGWVSTPILNDNFLRYIPWITAYIVLDIILDLYLLRQGFWDKMATGAKVLINMFKIAVNFAIITGPAILTIDAASLQWVHFSTEMTTQSLSHFANLGLNIILGLAIFGLVVDSIKRLYEGFIKVNPANLEITE
jgi:hypothetical protein